jgi:DNA transformation protein
MRLSKMPNIGTVLEDRLIKAGIENSEQLINIGSKDAFLRIRTIDEDACFNNLCALEGAIQGIRWHYLNDDKKEELSKFFKSLE